MGNNIKTKPDLILAIDTSCDETSVAITDKTSIQANIVWSQASLHAQYGGVYPTLAKREHQKKIDFVINQALKKSGATPQNLDAVAVTIGPGLAPALEVGLEKAKEISLAFKKPLFAANHLEGHILSVFAKPKNTPYQPIDQYFPILGLVISGGNTQLVLSHTLGHYQILAETADDALGEALDKGARLLGLGYPGGAALEKLALLKTKKTLGQEYPLPIPLLGRENLAKFSYSGLKTALVRLTEKLEREQGHLTKEEIINLAYSYQNTAFIHLTRVIQTTLQTLKTTPKFLAVGGGVAANNQVRRELRHLAKENSLKTLFPYKKSLCGDNAAMIGVSVFLKTQADLVKPVNFQKIDRLPDLKLNSES